GNGKSADFPFIYEGKALNDISCIISLRAAGNMGFDAVREKFLFEFGAADKKIFHCVQRHTRRVASVAKNDSCLIHDVDGLAANDSGIGLFVTIADCLPVFLFDTVSGAFSVLHSGWKGTGIAENAVKLLKEIYQSKPENIAAILGPCIHSCCYNVDEERALLYEKEFGGDEKNAADFPLGAVVKKKEINNYINWYIDMQAANAALLVKNGVRNIAYCLNCTFTDENFGSFRRQGADDFTKMMALAISP
ncbi:MAG: polyphenol oxidase family protein, partial [Spirochaetaceae bacterium]|nr:polyphenol oxidase family protein [Spirochaetaceae bacterium]